MWKNKQFRSRIIERLQPMLSNAIYSYAETGIELPRFNEGPMDEISLNGERVFEPYWYDHTYFSLAVETFVTNNDCELFITEKTYKPTAFQHPFMSISMPGTLAYIKQQGFETFENLFDESYDSITNFEDRLSKIVANINTFDPNAYNDTLTVEKIKHNHALFFNTELVKSKLVTDLVDPIWEFANG
jgi:hypothetical protein